MTKSKKQILVAGGAGYIGSHTVVSLLEQDFKVVIVDNLVNSDKIAVERIKDITKCNDEDLKFYESDLCDSKELEEIFIECGKFDACIHFAGLKAVGESCSKPLLYYKNNLISTFMLLDMLKKYECYNLIFSSSATVYGTGKPPLKENMSLSATNPYGRTKLFIEEILRDVALTDEKWKFVLLRYFNPVGAHKSGKIGENPVGIPNNLLPYIAQVAVGRRSHLSVFGDDYDTKDGTGVRDYIHVVDLAAGHVAALQKAIFGKVMKTNCEVYNLGTGNGYSVLEMLKAFGKACGKDLPYKITARRPGDVDICYADPTKAHKELEWETTKTLQDICDDAWKWQSQNPYGFSTKEEAEKKEKE